MIPLRFAWLAVFAVGVDRGGLTYALLHEDGELVRILNVEELLAAIGRVGNVQL